MAEEGQIVVKPTATTIKPADNTSHAEVVTTPQDSIRIADTTNSIHTNADQSDTQQSSIGDLMDGIINALVAIVDGFVTVLKQNATTIAEITVVGGIIYGAIRLFGGAFGQLRGLVGV